MVEVASSEGQSSNPLHRVAGVGCDVEDCGLELGSVGFDSARPQDEIGGNADSLAHGPVEQIVHLPYEGVEIEPLGLQRLTAGKGKQLAGEARGVGRGLDDGLCEADALRLGELGAGKHVGRALDDGELVVEVMRDPAGELAERLHLLGLAQLVLGLGALFHLLLEQSVGLGQRLGPRGELAVGLAKLALGQAQGGDDECGEEEHAEQDEVSRQGPRPQILIDVEIDRADALPGLRDRGLDSDIVADRWECSDRWRGRLAGAIVARDQRPLAVVDADQADLVVDPIGIGRLLGCGRIVEVDRCGCGRGEHVGKALRLVYSGPIVG